MKEKHLMTSKSGGSYELLKACSLFPRKFQQIPATIFQTFPKPYVVFRVILVCSRGLVEFSLDFLTFEKQLLGFFQWDPYHG